MILDEPKGKNNGTVDGKKYFECKDNFGMFCRQSQVKILSAGDSPGRSSKTPSRENSSLTSRQKSDLTRGPTRQKSDLSTPTREKARLNILLEIWGKSNLKREMNLIFKFFTDIPRTFLKIFFRVKMGFDRFFDF